MTPVERRAAAQQARRDAQDMAEQLFTRGYQGDVWLIARMLDSLERAAVEEALARFDERSERSERSEPADPAELPDPPAPPELRPLEPTARR